MKKTLIITAAMLLLLITTTQTTKAQEWNTSLDVYSSYIWRGLKFGSGPAFQPTVEFSSDGFSIGGWGSINSSDTEALEMDLYAGYSFDLNDNSTLGLTLTDYYFGGDWTKYKDMHNLEPSLSLETGDFSLTAAYMFLCATDSRDFAEEGDMYIEAGYSFGAVSLAVGAGDGQYTDLEDCDGDFNICNISIGTSKDVKITDSYTLPISGAVILNPTTGGFFITVGATLF